jgi:UPF0755 protein
MHSPRPFSCNMRSPFRTDLARRPLAALLLAGLALANGCGGEPHGEPVRVVIPRGASFAVAADSLARRGVVGSARAFRAYVSFSGKDRALKAGTYEFRRGTEWASIVDALVSGKGVVHTVVIPEGFDLTQIVPLLARTLGTPADSVEAAVRDTALLRRLDIPTATVEGYLFPATYSLPAGTTARQAVEEMVARFETAWKPEWDTRLQQLTMRRNDVVTLASIVEKEARRGEERPVISAVYHNRLRRGMRLQADPTVQYALGRHVDRVLYKDLETDSPYNTYRNAGLPPGPIASPGAASLEAALHPANVPYLFFVARADGHHEFRETFAQHEQAIREIRRAEGKR